MDSEQELVSNASQNSSVEPSQAQIDMDLLADKLLAQQVPGVELEKAPKVPSKSYKHPMAIDLLLAVGLLFAMAGLTVSFVKTYITHSAKTSILQGNYKAAIGILHGSPIPEFFGGAGTDSSEDLLNQALYLDAMEKLDANRDDQTALQELAKVKATQGSYFYDLAQDQFRKLKMQADPQAPPAATPKIESANSERQPPAPSQEPPTSQGAASQQQSSPIQAPLAEPSAK
ncbi:MAG: hypothetical protein KGS72_02135 [Cyanobacteria bacterium REEB67]|nr:hypothetical protein [Cyanobacteria bacterium REEB67]